VEFRVRVASAAPGKFCAMPSGRPVVGLGYRFNGVLKKGARVQPDPQLER
jgi:hypothetical protein